MSVGSVHNSNEWSEKFFARMMGMIEADEPFTIDITSPLGVKQKTLSEYISIFECSINSLGPPAVFIISITSLNQVLLSLISLQLFEQHRESFAH